MFNFHLCCMSQSFSCFYACFTLFVHFTVILAVMLNSAILMPKNSMCPILPLNKNNLRNYLEPKNYLEAPEWQDYSWSGNCRHKFCLPIVHLTLCIYDYEPKYFAEKWTCYFSIIRYNNFIYLCADLIKNNTT